MNRINKTINRIHRTNDPKTEEYKGEFFITWLEYPRKIGRAKAEKAYIKARKNGVSMETISDGLYQYLSYIEYHNIDPFYIKHGSSWFENHCWNDQYNELGGNQNEPN